MTTATAKRAPIAAPKLMKERLENAVVITPEERAAAETTFAEAKMKLSISQSAISSILVSMCHVAFTKSSQFGTMAVTITGDGNPLLVINIDFLAKLGAEGAKFVLTHEVYHLLLRHLTITGERRGDPIWTLATEAWINNRVKSHLACEMPVIDGEISGVDPEKVWAEYRTAGKKADLNPVAKDTFYTTDETTYAELCRMPKPPKDSKNDSICVRDGDPSDGQGGDGEGSTEDEKAPLDQEQLDRMAEKVLEAALQAAKNGRPGAKEELLALMDATPGAKTWGDLGAGVLRGETTHSRKTDLWAQWVRHTIGSKIADGDRLRYNKKLPWDPRVSPNGPGEKKHGSVYVDASGSMYPDTLEQIAALIGDDDEMDIEWHSFDGEVWDFAPGEGFQGGGGTSFSIIEDHIYDKDEDQDFVLVVTDGYAPHISPRDPDIWVWLIVPGGDAWPAAAGMSCREVDFSDANASV